MLAGEDAEYNSNFLAKLEESDLGSLEHGDEKKVETQFQDCCFI
jgi:hypothetical protein